MRWGVVALKLSGPVAVVVLAGAVVVASVTSATAAIVITGANIKDGTVTGADVRNGSLRGIDVADGGLLGADVRNESLTGADVRDGSIGLSDLAASARIPGPAGPIGPKGPAGAPGTDGRDGIDGVDGKDAQSPVEIATWTVNPTTQLQEFTSSMTVAKGDIIEVLNTSTIDAGGCSDGYAELILSQPGALLGAVFTGGGADVFTWEASQDTDLAISFGCLSQDAVNPKVSFTFKWTHAAPQVTFN
jgi:hypothetical protein